MYQLTRACLDLLRIPIWLIGINCRFSPPHKIHELDSTVASSLVGFVLNVSNEILPDGQ